MKTACRAALALGLALVVTPGFVAARNPVIADRGLNDPHVRVVDGKAYLFTSRDRSGTSKAFAMEDWRVFSSTDLIHWLPESVITPQQTFIGRPYTGCWAPDAMYHKGKWYFYFSESNQRTGVMVADKASGPWKDPLGKPLLTSDLTPTDEYDMGLFKDDDGTPYIIFGVWDYYIARLNDDMISLAEKPRLVVLDQKVGPYGKGKLDDKPFLHRANGRYYLSWGCFYATADSPYGPYKYEGAFMAPEKFAPGYAAPTWPNGPLQGRHGGFFDLHGQNYFIYCDMSQTGNRYFRDSFISYVHYTADGLIPPVRVDGVGVGEYRVETGPIQAEDFFRAEGIAKEFLPPDNFAVKARADGGYVTYPNIWGLGGCDAIDLQISGSAKGGTLELRSDSPTGALLARVEVKAATAQEPFAKLHVKFDLLPPSETLCVVFVSAQAGLTLDWLHPRFAVNP